MRVTARMRFGAAVASLALAVGATAPAFAEGQVNLLTWEGYADASYMKLFEEKSGCKVTATYVGSNDDFAPKLAAGGGVYDVITPSIDTTGIMIAAGFVEPVDTDKIEGWGDIYEKFREAEGIRKGDEVYGVPFVWGSIPFMYRTDKIAEAPTSLKALWDPQYKGKISLWDDKSALYVAARLNGAKDIYDLSDEELEAAKKKLIEQKPLVRKYWATAGELVDLYAGGEVWISNTWGGYQSNELKKQGIPMQEFIPEEGAEGWMDSNMIVKGTPNADCVYKLLNFYLTPEGQCGVSAVTGYSVANKVSAEKCMTPERYKELHQDDPDYLDSLLLWENLGPRLEAYTNTWNAVKAAQ